MMAKNPVNYEKERKEESVFEQRSMTNFDDFSDTEENEIKQPTEKRNAENREKETKLRPKNFK